MTNENTNPESITYKIDKIEQDIESIKNSIKEINVKADRMTAAVKAALDKIDRM